MLRVTHRRPARLVPYYGSLLAALLFALCWSTRSSAHVLMDTPANDTTFAVGSTIVMTWEDLILHDGIGYDLDLIGPDPLDVTSIVSGLSTSTHTYNWVVPDIVCVGCYLRVTQVNRGHNYDSSVLVNLGMAPPSGSGSGASGAPGASPSSAGSSSASAVSSASGAGGDGSAPKSSAGGGGAHAASESSGTAAASGAADVSSAGHAGALQQGQQASSSASGGDASLDVPTDAGAPDQGASASVGGTTAGTSGSPGGGGCAFSSHPDDGGSVLFGLFALALGRRRRRAERDTR